MSDSEALDELARLRDLLGLIQELTSTVVRSESVGDLFGRAYATLYRCVPFDVAAAVMLEQNLDLYVSTRAGAEALLDDPLIAKIRRSLEALIPVSFATTEVVVKAEMHDLPPGEAPAVDHEASALLQHDRRAAGLLLLGRRDAFSDREQQILTIFATQVSMLLDMIRARERISNLADTDELTGIWNRRYFRRQMLQEMERARTFNVPLSMLLFDIDDFKQVNDSFGHVIGDIVLSELCGTVKDTVRPTDILARFGGDEFAVILPHTDLRGATRVAQRILAGVALLTIPTDEESAIQCSVSIGIAEFQRDDIVANDLVRRADERLYLSKRQGKNRYTS